MQYFHSTRSDVLYFRSISLSYILSICLSPPLCHSAASRDLFVAEWDKTSRYKLNSMPPTDWSIDQWRSVSPYVMRINPSTFRVAKFPNSRMWFFHPREIGNSVSEIDESPRNFLPSGDFDKCHEKKLKNKKKTILCILYNYVERVYRIHFFWMMDVENKPERMCDTLWWAKSFFYTFLLNFGKIGMKEML